MSSTHWLFLADYRHYIGFFLADYRHYIGKIDSFRFSDLEHD